MDLTSDSERLQPVSLRKADTRETLSLVWTPRDSSGRDWDVGDRPVHTVEWAGGEGSGAGR